jgi:hemerythrin
MAFIDKSEIPVVALDEMNDVHFEEVEIINQLDEIINADMNPDEKNELINNKLQELQTHTVTHFANEERLMRLHGFPPYPIHKYNHDQLLSELAMIVRNWEADKDIQALRKYLKAGLKEWLANHIATLDTVTAMFLKEKIG